MSQEKLNRRDFFKRAAILGAAAAGAGSLLSACEPGGQQQDGADQQEGDQQDQQQAAADGELNCEDTSGLEDNEIQTRESLDYTDESPRADQDQFCHNCSLYQEPEQEGTCGGCQTVPGPIHPEGWCTAWVAAA